MTSKKDGKGNAGTQQSSVDQGIAPANPQAAAMGGAAHNQSAQSPTVGSTDPDETLKGVSLDPLSADELVKQARKIIVDHIEAALSALGKLFLFAVFAGVWRDVLHGKPTKHTLMKKVLAHKDAKQHRRQYVEALLVSALDHEWIEKGLQFSSLDYRHKSILAKIKDENLRLSFAQRADKDQLSPRDLQTEIRDHMLSLQSSSAEAQHVVRQIKTMIGFMKDQDTRALLTDRNRLEAIDEDSRMEILRYSKQISKISLDINELFGTVSETIIDIEADDDPNGDPDGDVDNN